MDDEAVNIALDDEEPLYLPVSRALVEQATDWSEPVEVRLVGNADGLTCEMYLRKVITVDDTVTELCHMGD